LSKNPHLDIDGKNKRAECCISCTYAKVPERALKTDTKKCSACVYWELKCNKFILAYSSLLTKWNLMIKRAEILKFLTNPNLLELVIDTDAISLRIYCYKCHSPCEDGGNCTRCNTVPLRCAICRLVVKGLCLFCCNCGHGGHPEHMESWYNNFGKTIKYANNVGAVCPVEGCGCVCSFEKSY